MALSQFGISWSTIMDFRFSVAMSGFQFDPRFRMEKIVRYTSPGFLAIEKLNQGFISLDEARSTLENLSRTDSNFGMHVNPGGESYLEVLCSLLFLRQSNI